MTCLRIMRASLGAALALALATPVYGLAGDLAAAGQPPSKKTKASQPAGASSSSDHDGFDGDSDGPPSRDKSKRKRRPRRPAQPPQQQTYAPPRSPGRQTIYFGGGSHAYGFEIAASTATSKVQESAARFESFGFGIITDHMMLWGVQATRQAKPVEHAVAGFDLESSLNYASLVHGWILGWQSIFNMRSTIGLGGGLLEVSDPAGIEDPETFSIVVAEPLMGFYFNLIPALRFGFDLSYRFVVVDEPGVRGESYSGVTGALSLRGGDF